MTARASAAFCSSPAAPIAIGTIPTIIAAAVISTGRIRVWPAAIAAGSTRLRPVLMTAAAMIVGMLPMAIGGAGEEQNAVLARAVIGGLLFGTTTTLLVVPYLYVLLRRLVGEHKRNEPDFGDLEGHSA